MSDDISKINELSDYVCMMQLQESALAADLKRVKSAISQAEYELVALMRSNHLSTIGSKLSVAELEEKLAPLVVDWGSVYQHIQHTGDFDLLHRRISLTAFNERLQGGVTIPGIEARTLAVVKVSQKG